MISYLPKLDPENNIKPVYNKSDFEYIFGYATLADLLNYANLYSSNIFNSLNIFQSGLEFNGFINNVSSDTFDYLKNVSSDIQTQFNNLTILLTNYIYYSDTNTSGVNSSFTSPNFISNDIETNNLKTNNIQCNDILTNNLNVNSNINCKNIYALNIPLCWFSNQNTLYPVIKSGLLSKFTGINLNSGFYITLSPGYQIIFYDYLNIPQFTLINNTDDYIYYYSVNVSNSNSFIITKI